MKICGPRLGAAFQTTTSTASTPEGSSKDSASLISIQGEYLGIRIKTFNCLMEEKEVTSLQLIHLLQCIDELYISADSIKEKKKFLQLSESVSKFQSITAHFEYDIGPCIGQKNMII